MRVLKKNINFSNAKFAEMTGLYHKDISQFSILCEFRLYEGQILRGIRFHSNLNIIDF